MKNSSGGRVNTRRILRCIALASAISGLFIAQSATSQTGNAPEIIKLDVQSRAITAFEARDPSRRRFGKLDFRGGLQLISAHKEFGGLSALRIEADGERFLAVTDKGFWLRGRLTYTGTQPSGIADVELAPLLTVDGRPIQKRRWYDSEALAEDGGTAYVALERVHQILKFDFGKYGLMAPGQVTALPPEFRNLRSNKGIEGLVVIPKGLPNAGALIAFAERGREEADDIPGFLLGVRPITFSVRRSGDFDLTDAAITPAGDLLILERHFSYLRGVSMRIRRLAMQDIVAGAVLDGPILIEADMGFQIDNMEGLAVHRSATGETVLTLVSDDNFSALQRTLLLQFTLVEP